jgi:hypothetical protein
MAETIIDALNKQPYASESVHTYSAANQHNTERAQAVVQKDDLKFQDNYEINHGLSRSEVRTLFKILAKELPDCGRKRGAILRYIKHYHKPEQHSTGYSLYQHLATK